MQAYLGGTPSRPAGQQRLPELKVRWKSARQGSEEGEGTRQRERPEQRPGGRQGREAAHS